MLRAEHLNVSYGRVQVLWDVSFNLERKQIATILGYNGAGKSTLLNTLVGLNRCHPGGKIVFNGTEIQDSSPYEIVDHGLALAPEGRRLFLLMDVKTNLELGAYTKRGRERINDSLDLVYTLFPVLKERRNQVCRTLSGGEQQMVNIGRALMSRPDLLILDEPSFGLSPLLVQRIFDTVVELNKRGLTIVVVEQRAVDALRVSDMAYVLSEGRVVLEGPTSDVTKDERIRKAYLGL
jgi:branched-chain amino acid transport system ATP-binding protein